MLLSLKKIIMVIDNKKKGFIKLLAIIMVVVILIITVVIVVEKIDREKYKKNYYDINETIDCKNYQYKVSNLSINEDLNLGDNKRVLLITIELKAKKSLTIKSLVKDFSLNDYKLDSYICDNEKVNNNDDIVLYLKYIVERSNVQLFLKNKANYVRLGCALI